MATRELAEIKDKNGDVNELRDKKLADSIAKNTVVNTDNVRMVDTNGKEVFIARDSFISAIRNVLGGFILSNTKAEAPNIPVFDSNGDFGAITAANLASVLGVGIMNRPPINVWETGLFSYKSDGVSWILLRFPSHRFDANPGVEAAYDDIQFALSDDNTKLIIVAGFFYKAYGSSGWDQWHGFRREI